jgi:Flp pilus assembly pilin Flp
LGVNSIKDQKADRAMGIRFPRDVFRQAQGQAVTEYILIFALVALIFVAVLGTWKGPLAHYLNRIAQAVAATR